MQLFKTHACCEIFTTIRLVNTSFTLSNYICSYGENINYSLSNFQAHHTDC